MIGRSANRIQSPLSSSSSFLSSRRDLLLGSLRATTLPLATLLALCLAGNAAQAQAMPGMTMPMAPAAAATPPPLEDGSHAKDAMSLAQFLAMAESNAPALKLAAEQVTQARAQARQAGLYPNPTIGYQGDQIRGGSYGGGEQGGFIEQTIVLGGKLGLRKDVYNAEGRAGEIGVEQTRRTLNRDVSLAFYQGLTAQRLVALRKQLLGVAEDAVKTAGQLANVGQADAPDVLQAEVEAEQARVDFDGAQRDYRARFRELAALSGRADLAVVPLAGVLEDVPAIDAEAVLQASVAASPAVRRADQQVLVEQAGLKAANRDAVPDLTLKAGEQYSEELVRERPNIPTGPESFASASMQLPLWNRNQGARAVAVSRVSAAKDSVRQVRLDLQRQGAGLAEAYAAAQVEADRYKTEMIPRAAKAHAMYLEKYEDMGAAYPQVLVSQRTLFELQIRYVAALGRQWSAAVNLEGLD